jgi:hypothetical protein
VAFDGGKEVILTIQSKKKVSLAPAKSEPAPLVGSLWGGVISTRNASNINHSCSEQQLRKLDNLGHSM